MKITNKQLESLASLREILLKETQIFVDKYEMTFDNENSTIEFIHEKRPHLRVFYDPLHLVLMIKLIIMQYEYHKVMK